MNSTHESSRTFRRLFEFTRRYRGLVSLTVIAGLLNLALTFIIPWLIGSAIDRVIAPDWVRHGDSMPPTYDERIHWLWILISIGVGTAFSFGIISYLRGHYSVMLGNRIIADLRNELFDHLQRLSLHFYAKERTGSIMSRLIHDIQQAGNLINGGVVLVAMDILQTVLACVVLFAINYKLALACLGILPIYAMTFRLFNNRVRIASERVQNQISKISGNVQERLSAIALIKINDAEHRERKRFRDDTEEHYDRIVAQSNVAHLIGSISETLVHVGTMIVIGYGSYLALKRDHGMSAGGMTRFLGYLGMMYGPLRRFADLNIMYQTSAAALQRVFSVFDITPKIVEAKHAVAAPPQKGAVKFDHVVFGYDDDSDESRGFVDEHRDIDPEDWAVASRGTGEPVLKSISFDINAGECIALVGPSGAGKTTIVSLLPRLYDVTTGRILIDGVDIRDYKLSALRQSIAIVQQESMLFSGTIRDNLAYGRPGATEEQIIAAAKAANAHEFISAYPQKYSTIIGERGVNLSGGQRQRLSIARALLKNPRILILDEATSALDSESEAAVQIALKRLMEGRTCFVIAHRLSTVRDADRILVIESGRVVETGSHDELIAQSGRYARFVRLQFARDIALENALRIRTEHELV